MSKLKCISVSKQGWNDETSVFENEDFKVVVTLKNQKHHGEVNVGDKLPFEIGKPKSTKKAAKKTTAKKTAVKKTAVKKEVKAETPTV